MKVLLPLIAVLSSLVASGIASSLETDNSENDLTDEICSLPWIAECPELGFLKGVLIRGGDLKRGDAYSVITSIFDEVGSVPKSATRAFYLELLNLFRAKTTDLQMYMAPFDYFRDGKCGPDIAHLATIDKEFDFLKPFLLQSSSTVVFDSETTEIFRDYFQKHPESFLEILKFPNDVEIWKFLLSLEFDDDRLRTVFEHFSYFKANAISAIEALCTKTSDSYLLKPEVKRQVMTMYSILSPESQLTVEKLLYYRSLLDVKDLKGSTVPVSEAEFDAMILGWKRMEIVKLLPANDFLVKLNQLEDIDPSVIDWALEIIDEYPGLWKALSVTVSEFFGADLPTASKTKEFSFKNRKLLAYALSKNADFENFLLDVPPFYLTAACEILAKNGTPQELNIFLSRAKKLTVAVFFKAFWEAYEVEERFVECAQLLLNRVAGFSNCSGFGPIRPSASASNKFFKNPAILQSLVDMKIKVLFKFDAIKAAVLDDSLYENMLPFKQVFIDSLQENHFDICIFPLQITRILTLLNQTPHQYLRDHLLLKNENGKARDGFTYSTLAFLKFWASQNPEEFQSMLNHSDEKFKILFSQLNVTYEFLDESCKSHVLALIYFLFKMKKEKLRAQMEEFNMAIE